MSSADNTDDGQTTGRLTRALTDTLDPDESVADMTVEEFGEALREAGFKTKEEVEASLSGDGSPASGSGTGTGDDDRLEAFGTGIADDGETVTPPAESRAAVEANMNHSSNPEDYGTGVQATGSDRPTDSPTDTALNELTGSASGAPLADVDTDSELDKFGTGVAGDTSAAEYRQREEQAEVLARAIEKAEEHRNGE